MQLYVYKDIFSLGEKDAGLLKGLRFYCVNAVTGTPHGLTC